jgi:hypothetical protein
MTLSLFSFIGLLTFINCSVLAIITYVFGKQRLHKIWALFNVVTSIWGLGLFFVGDRSLAIDKALFWWKFAHIGGMLIPVVFLHTIYEILRIKERKFLFFFYAQATFFIFLTLFNKIGWQLKFTFDAFYYVTPKGIPYVLATVLWFIPMIYGFFILVRDYLKSTGVRKNQFRYLLVSFMIGFLGGSSHFLPVYGLNIHPFNILISVYTLIATYAILQYHLLDIKVALTRAGIFVIVYILVLGIPFWIGIKFLGKGSWIMPVSIMAVLATTGPFIYLFLQRRAESRLLAKRRKRQDKLRDLSSYMMRFTRLKLLANLIVHNVLKILQLKHASLYLLEVDPNKTKQFNRICSYGVPQKQALPLGISLDSALAIELTNGKTAIELEQLKHRIASANNHNILLQLEQELSSLKARIVIPTFLRFNLMGFLILGESRVDETFTQEDINVLQVLSNQAALAIENALFWQRDEEKLVESSKEEAASAVSFGAGHQFNNRLYAISMTVDGIFDALGNRDINQLSFEETRTILQKALIKLKKISEECQFGGQITAGIMSLTGTTPPNFAEFDISPIITSSIELVEMKHSKDKIEGNKPSVLITNNISQNLPLIFGSDAFSYLAFSGFNQVGAVAPEKCQPFDKNRRGMMVGEGAGIMVLETLDSAIKRKAPIYAEILGYGLSCDAFHMTNPQTEGIAECMQNALKEAGIAKEDVDYISAHGTGTRHNDKTECSAIKEVFGQRKIPTSSIKSMLGHTMGAASAIEALTCCLVVENDIIPPTINYETPDPECDIDCVPNTARKQKVNIALNNGFAFGGNNACVVIKKFK